MMHLMYQFLPSLLGMTTTFEAHVTNGDCHLNVARQGVAEVDTAGHIDDLDFVDYLIEIWLLSFVICMFTRCAGCVFGLCLSLTIADAIARSMNPSGSWSIVECCPDDRSA